MNNIEGNIFAIPSKGGFRAESEILLKQAGLNFRIQERELSCDMALSEVGDIRLGLIRPKDIVQMVAEREIPLGITSMDALEEFRLTKGRKSWDDVKVLLPLGIGLCRLVLAAPEERGFMTEEEMNDAAESGKFIKPRRGALEQFRGLTIATSYPNLTRRYFGEMEASLNYGDTFGSEKSMDFKLKEFSGSVEAAPALGLADAVSDLVETGKTLGANKLKEIETILESQGILITNLFNNKGDIKLVDVIRDRLFEVLLQRDNQDALRRKAQFEAYLASWR